MNVNGMFRQRPESQPAIAPNSATISSSEKNSATSHYRLCTQAAMPVAQKPTTAIAMSTSHSVSPSEPCKTKISPDATVAPLPSIPKREPGDFHVAFFTR